ncbi:MAG: hypothetical protein AMJ81_09465 [Phycisphaerae bacterium SM23_33]|nr:MAG: hypothetical protein AMJ81_09465 [Phycisphaerae bacterium SM23_33]
MPKLAIILSAACLLAAAPAAADFVTERWGPSGRCRHAGAASFQAAPGGGVVAKFDLSKLPRRAGIYRARLRVAVPAGPGPLKEPILVEPLMAEVSGSGRAAGQEPLPLVGPRYRSFDATDVVRRWASGKLANHGLWVRAPGGWDRLRTYLEISYDGRLKDPPPPVTGLKAFHRAGQVFLTFDEVDCPFAGKQELSWDEMKALQQKLAAGKLAEVCYRVYRHTRPITAGNLREAELLDEVEQLSAFDERMIQTEWKGERIKNVRVGQARVPRVCVEPLKEVPVGTGVFVRTSEQAGEFYYAVISAADGVENTTAIHAGNSLQKPLKETVARPQPILHHEEEHIYDKPRGHRFYLLWTDPPLSNVPNYYHMGVTFPPELPKQPAPLYVEAWWWDNGWAGSGARRAIPGCISLHMETPWVLHKGIHEGCGTCKAWSQGTVQDYWVRRLRNVLPWLRQQYHIDPDRMYAMSSDWAWHHPDLFAAVHENLTTDPKRSPTAIGSDRFWGEPKTPAATEWKISAWDYYDIAGYLKKHVRFEVPMLYYTPNMHEGDFGTIDKPRFYRAMQDTKRAFIAAWGMHVSADWIYELRRDDTLAAFTHCSLDSNPGIGMDDGDREGQINGYLRFDAATAVDAPDRWEMAVWLAGPDLRGRGGAPEDACTVDVTPRRCRKFQAAPGQKFKWTNTLLAPEEAKKEEKSPALKPLPPSDEKVKMTVPAVTQTGTAVADEHGLVTAEKVLVTRGRHRIVISR